MAKTSGTATGPDTRRIVVRVTPDFHRRLRVRVAADDTTVAEIARELLGRYVDGSKSVTKG